MRYKFFLFVLFIFFPLFIFSQDTVKQDILINSIEVNGLKKTNLDYFFKIIPIKKGDVWDEKKKEELEKELDDMEDIISSYTINEEDLVDNNVNLILNIKEKGAFILIPFATYSSSKGLKPQVIFRYYNLGGYRKKLISEIEFYPTESLNIILKYKDPDVLNNKKFSYELNTDFRFSTLNYFANYDFENKKYKLGTVPIGVIGGNPFGPWNDEHFIKIKFGGKLNYTFSNDIKIKPNFKIEYEKIFEKLEKVKLDTFKELAAAKNVDEQYARNNLGSDIINPKIGLDLMIPFKKKNVSFVPKFNLEYKLSLGEEKLKSFEELEEEAEEEGEEIIYLDILQDKFFGNAYDSLKPEIKLGFTFNIPRVNAKVKPYTGLIYEKITSYDYVRATASSPASLNPTSSKSEPTSHFIDLLFGVDFDKKITFKKGYHKFGVDAEYKQRVLGDTTIKRDWGTKIIPFFFSSVFFFNYELDLNVFKLHRYKMELEFFATYNQLRAFSKYDVGKKPGKMEGFLGIAGNLKYELPLFYVSTPKLVTKSMKRELNWQVYWDFYIDFGLAFTDIADDPFTLDQNFLHLYPALGVATGIRVIPQFLPIEIELVIGADAYNIVRTKALNGGNIVIEFAINDKL